MDSRLQMHLKYTHYFGNESSEELLESYGIETRKGQRQDILLKPKQCPNCSESNIPIQNSVLNAGWY
jgi:hypothetical protein